jgi:DNA-binding CsgD family transcriptional regulator
VPTARRQLAMMHDLAGQGLTPPEIATRLNCSRASVYRLLKEDRA